MSIQLSFYFSKADGKKVFVDFSRNYKKKFYEFFLRVYLFSLINKQKWYRQGREGEGGDNREKDEMNRVRSEVTWFSNEEDKTFFYSRRKLSER